MKRISQIFHKLKVMKLLNYSELGDLVGLTFEESKIIIEVVEKPLRYCIPQQINVKFLLCLGWKSTTSDLGGFLIGTRKMFPEWHLHFYVTFNGNPNDKNLIILFPRSQGDIQPKLSLRSGKIKIEIKNQFGYLSLKKLYDFEYLLNKRYEFDIYTECESDTNCKMFVKIDNELKADKSLNGQYLAYQEMKVRAGYNSESTVEWFSLKSEPKMCKYNKFPNTLSVEY